MFQFFHVHFTAVDAASDLSHYLGHDITNEVENLKAIYANAINNDERYNAP